MTESKDALKSFLMKVKEESRKVGLKFNIQKTKIMVSGPITSWQIDGETVETVTDFFFFAPKLLQMVTAAMKLRRLLTGRKAMTNLDSRDIKKQRHYFVNKGPSSQSYSFSSSHVWLDYKESWALKNWCFWTVVLKTLESPLDSKEIEPVHLNENQS